ncbi:peptidylprolyl isomerase [Jannaschia sp. Os4]|uniref:peptidylprolyl isomerase n=1 Tax=Jannaschia sp. Os4 TaxID=2807617 RepID=UPI00193A4D7B|nr:peptidylprolyl isomerase [Jannaschia sp. Os4]MBM2577487.1 peptidylprolyl isomerase [Jannaschia sp. Os4]
MTGTGWARRAGAMLLAALLAAGGQPAAAQNLFAPAATVDGTTITDWQVNQRARFFGLINAPGADYEGARDRLIEETIQVEAARRSGIVVTAEALDEAMVEFAGRADLAPDEFIQILEARGIAGETFRDFVRNQLYWRDLIRQRFGPQARPTEAEVDRAVASAGAGGAGARALLSEIALPLTPDNAEAQRRLAERLADTLRGEAAFSAAARRFSAAPTAGRGGRLDWVPLANLPPEAATRILTLEPGQVAGPIDFGSFLALFLVRQVDEGGAPADALSVDYAIWPLAGGRTAEGLAAAAALRARVDTCDDLYGVARRAGRPDALIREVATVDSLPGDLRTELAKLDDDEVSTLIAANGTLSFVMLCGRVAEVPEGARDQIGGQLVSQRLTTYAQGFLEELRSDAVVERF